MLITVNDRSYNRYWAWWPVRVSKGDLVWFEHYYMRPDRNGQGLLLTRDQWLVDSGQIS